jgi:ribosomal protein S18 acetylase RimI-like enzyme
MASVALEPASPFTDAELAAAFTAAYEGYFIPFALDESAFRAMVDAYDDDLDASRVALVDGEPVGICKLALRGDQGWIDGVGVVPAHRGTGVGRALMKAAVGESRDRGVRDLWLEVLVQNEPAIRLYESLGFEQVRDVEVWALDDFVSHRHKLSTLALAEALGREERPPWQRADESVRNAGDAVAHGDERGVLVYRAAGTVASILQCAAADAAAASALLTALPGEITSVRWLNGPEGHPLGEALAALGGTVVHRQHEMVLRL